MTDYPDFVACNEAGKTAYISRRSVMMVRESNHGSCSVMLDGCLMISVEMTAEDMVKLLEGRGPKPPCPPSPPSPRR